MKIKLILWIILCLSISPVEGRSSSHSSHSSGYSRGSRSHSYSHRSGTGYHISRSYSPGHARSSHLYHKSSAGHFYAAQSRTVHSYSSHFAAGVARDARGRIARSSVSRHAFEAATGYPHGRPGYVVDHIVPLKRGGGDVPSNMQWQTKEEAKAKDRWE